MCVFLMGWFDVDMKALTDDDRSRIEVKKTTIDKEVMMFVFDLDIVTLLIMLRACNGRRRKCY